MKEIVGFEGSDKLRSVGVIGYPLRHSISPAFQQAALDYYGLDIRYELWETEPKDLQSMVEQLRQLQSLGANVTVPYKQAVLPLLDELDDLASRIEAVNTIVRQEDRLTGYNTDAYGFLQALRQHGKFEPEGREAIVIGAGGAARAACYALLEAGVVSLTIVNRTRERAEALAWALEGRVRTRVDTLPWGDARLGEVLSQCHLIVNCTTMGMKCSSEEGESPLEARLIPRGILVYDLVYNPLETPLLRVAKVAGAHTLGGLAMLVYQGAAAFELWTNRKAPLDVMFEAARVGLSEEKGGCKQ